MAWFVLARVLIVAAVAYSAALLQPLPVGLIANVAFAVVLAALVVAFETRLRDIAPTRVMFEQTDTWWHRLVRTRRRADRPGVPSSTCSDRMPSETKSIRSTRSGGRSSLASCPNSATFPS